MNEQRPNSAEIHPLLEQVRQGSTEALNGLLDQHRPWIRRLIALRLDPRLRRRVDPSDVVQEVHLEVARRIEDYLEREPMPFQLWLRQTAYDKLIDLRRKHLEAECRTVQREVMLAEDSSIQLIQLLLGQDNPPDRRMLEQELAERLNNALDKLPEHDREVVLMRVFEGLDNQEVSQVLGIHPSTGSKHFGRALFQLRAILLKEEGSDT